MITCCWEGPCGSKWVKLMRCTDNCTGLSVMNRFCRTFHSAWAAASFTLHACPAQEHAFSWGTSLGTVFTQVKSVNHTLLWFRHPIHSSWSGEVNASSAVVQLRWIFNLETQVLTRLPFLEGTGICVRYFADYYLWCWGIVLAHLFVDRVTSALSFCSSGI